MSSSSRIGGTDRRLCAPRRRPVECGTKEMVLLCLTCLHVISLVWQGSLLYAACRLFSRALTADPLNVPAPSGVVPFPAAGLRRPRRRRSAPYPFLSSPYLLSSLLSSALLSPLRREEEIRSSPRAALPLARIARQSRETELKHRHQRPAERGAGSGRDDRWRQRSTKGSEKVSGMR